MPNDSPELPPCTRCGHTIDEHVRPQGKKLPWPCRKCECPGFVIARDLHEDVKHTSGLRIESAVQDLLDRNTSTEEILDIIEKVLVNLSIMSAEDDEKPD